MEQRAVVSLGHEALGYNTMEQKEAVRGSAEALAELASAGYQLTVTHSNGPQVSMIHKAMTELRRIYIDYTPAPMCVCNAMSQGYVGYDLQNALHSSFMDRGIGHPVVTLLTQVTVDPYDEAFYEPTKTIGRYMSAEDAELETKKGNFVKEFPGQGFLRIVAAPKPIRIVEIDAIRTLAESGAAVIACGGGGIPVIEQGHRLKGASAVIEKDAIAGRLAIDLSADILVILTSVPYVYTSFGRTGQAAIESMDISRAGQLMSHGEFGATDMLPKIQAGIEYLRAVPGGRVLITSLARVHDALKGRAGTIMTA